MDKNTTIVTGLWDLQRGNLQGWAHRDFSAYRDRFFKLLECDAQMCIWIPRDMEAEVKAIRGDKPTQIYFKEREDFKTWFPFFDAVQKIRSNPEWRNSAGWLAESPQAALEFYNPMMMSKMFMVNDTAIMNPFGSKYFYWIDGGLTHTVPAGYFLTDKVLDKLASYSNSIKKIVTINYPYESNTEIHGFERTAMARYCKTDFVRSISRGGFWGGKKDLIHKMNDLYYGVLHDTMNEGLMGADECLFTILTHRHPELIHKFEIEGNGLVWPFFEHLKKFEVPETTPTVLWNTNTNIPAYTQTAEEVKMNEAGDGVSLYVVTFNSPPQLQLLLDTFEKSNPELLRTKKRFLINNSIDRSTDEAYDKICSKYGFEQIKKGNLGVCGARSWAAKHFHESDSKYIVWFEDDMLMEADAKLCKNGLAMHCDGWLDKCIHIVETETLDFLKISFSEFYGDHHEQWSWYNLPKDYKDKRFPTGEHRMKWDTSGCYSGLSYLTGEIYYSNWPSVMTRRGNYKVFLETPYHSPFEQTIMSHCYQIQQKGEIRSGVLMASLVNHNRVYHYAREIRKEC